MKMDMVNYTIQSLQPQLQEHSIQFERAKYQDLLNKQPSMYINLRESGGGGGEYDLGFWLYDVGGNSASV